MRHACEDSVSSMSISSGGCGSVAILIGLVEPFPFFPAFSTTADPTTRTRKDESPTLMISSFSNMRKVTTSSLTRVWFRLSKSQTAG